MSAINREVSEQRLKDIFNAVFAIMKLTHTESEARKIANDIAYGVFRNIFTPDSIERWIISRASIQPIG